MAEGVRSTDVNLALDEMLDRVRQRVVELRDTGERFDEGELDVETAAELLVNAACEVPQLNPESPHVIECAIDAAAKAL